MIFFLNINMIMSIVDTEKSLASIIRGDFNARSNNWWSQDINNTEVSINDIFTCKSGYHQIINSPTLMVNTSSSFSLQTQVSLHNLLLKNHFITDIAVTTVLFLVR